ncbi:MAG: Uma2 family endonuclease [Neolewinella sp.]|jgi:Uma2 family endonuclease
MDAAQLKNQRYSREEYFQLAADSEVKLEFLDGEIRIMAGATKEHNRITKNCLLALNSNPNDCEVFLGDTAVSIPSSLSGRTESEPT